MDRKLMFSSELDTWCTPSELFNNLQKEFRFTLDSACSKKTALCKKFFTPKENGLGQDWKNEIVFVNPPYGRKIGDWVQKSCDEGYYGTAKVVMLIPARTDTRYFHDYILGKAEIRFIKGRLKFINHEKEGNKLSPAPFPSMIVIFGNKPEIYPADKLGNRIYEGGIL